MANESPNMNKPQDQKPGSGKPDQAPHKPGQQQEQKSGSVNQPGTNPPPKPQQG